MKAFAAFVRFPNGTEGVLLSSIRKSRTKAKAAVWNATRDERLESVEVLRYVAVDVSLSTSCGISAKMLDKLDMEYRA